MPKQRPTFLVAEPEAPDGLSSRKLVLETAKFNVLTAHSAKETLAMIEKFPEIDAVVVHVDLDPGSCAELVKEIRQRLQNVLIVVLSPSEHLTCSGADEFVYSHDPEALLKLLRGHFGNPM